MRVLKALIRRFKYKLERCNQPGCWRKGQPCFLPYEDGPSEYLCREHIEGSGYCVCCGDFWGGIESFEFLHPGVCDHCEDQLKADCPDDREDEDFCGYDYDCFEDQ